jgi:hypothetical protein
MGRLRSKAANVSQVEGFARYRVPGQRPLAVAERSLTLEALFPSRIDSASAARPASRTDSYTR